MGRGGRGAAGAAGARQRGAPTASSGQKAALWLIIHSTSKQPQEVYIIYGTHSRGGQQTFSGRSRSQVPKAWEITRASAATGSPRAGLGWVGKRRQSWPGGSHPHPRQLSARQQGPGATVAPSGSGLWPRQGLSAHLSGEQRRTRR